MKFISSSYCEKTGISTVTMQHLGIKFVGTAKLHPDDKENASHFEGCWLAEQRAIILALKYERYMAKKKSDEAIDFLKSCKGYAGFDPNSSTAKAIYRQVNRRIKKVNDITDKINECYKSIEKHQFNRKVVLNAIDMKKGVSKEDK
jgi:hypothetical protein